MKSALFYSLALHIAAVVLSMATVTFRAVRFVPRDVYSVQLIDITQLQQRVVEKHEEPTPPPLETPAPPEPEPEIKEEPPDELVPPPEKKPKKPNKDVKKTAERRKITQPPTVTPPIDTLEAVAQPASTGDVQLSVEDFPFAYYVSSMKRKIASYWEVPTSGRESMFCVVYFRVRRDGSVESLSVEKGSGQFLFDQAALRAVTRASPLPPLPDGFKENYLGVHFTFAYEREF